MWDVSHRFERVRVSDATRELLTRFAAADPEQSLADACGAIADWDEVFQGLCRNGLLGAAWLCLSAGADEGAAPAGVTRRIGQAHAVTALQTRAQMQAAACVFEAFAASGIDILVLKGPAVAALAYPDPALRAFGDLDLMARERDMERVHALLTELGFAPEQPLDGLRPKLTPLCTIYELVYADVDRRLTIEMHFDDLLNAGLASRDIEGYWQRAITVDLESPPVRTLSLDDHLVHLCAHMHFHGYVRLNWFTDIALLVRRHGDRIDWDRFVATVRAEDAHAAVYYSLRHLEDLLGVSVPAQVLAAIRPSRARRWFHEYYLPSSSVRSLAPMPRPDFSFYFRPYFKRLVPDLLVMGRRRDKLRYLVRLAAPPRAWLRHYYGVDHGRSVAPHYLYHPLKLAAHLARELLQTPRAPGAWWNVDAR